MGALVAVLALLPGCAWLAMNTGLPGLGVGTEIEVHGEPFDYIDATVSQGGASYRLLFPQGETCQKVLRAEDPTFRLAGIIGTVSAGGEDCIALGILSLRAWRDRAGRATREASRLVPNDRVDYRVIWTGDDLFFARGRFRLSNLVGWPYGQDTIAVFPNTAECAGVRAKQVGMMEFRTVGPVPLSIFDGTERCPFEGFAQPVPPN